MLKLVLIINEQTNVKVINQNVVSKDNVVDQKLGVNSKFKTWSYIKMVVAWLLKNG